VDAGVLGVHGAADAGAFWIGDSPEEGFISLGIMVALGLAFLLGTRSETLRGLGGPGATAAPTPNSAPPPGSPT